MRHAVALAAVVGTYENFLKCTKHAELSHVSSNRPPLRPPTIRCLHEPPLVNRPQQRAILGATTNERDVRQLLGDQNASLATWRQAASTRALIASSLHSPTSALAESVNWNEIVRGAPVSTPAKIVSPPNDSAKRLTHRTTSSSSLHATPSPLPPQPAPGSCAHPPRFVQDPNRPPVITRTAHPLLMPTPLARRGPVAPVASVKRDPSILPEWRTAFKRIGSAGKTVDLDPTPDSNTPTPCPTSPARNGLPPVQNPPSNIFPQSKLPQSKPEKLNAKKNCKPDLTEEKGVSREVDSDSTTTTFGMMPIFHDVHETERDPRNCLIGDGHVFGSDVDPVDLSWGTFTAFKNDIDDDHVSLASSEDFSDDGSITGACPNASLRHPPSHVMHLLHSSFTRRYVNARFSLSRRYAPKSVPRKVPPVMDIASLTQLHSGETAAVPPNNASPDTSGISFQFLAAFPRNGSPRPVYNFPPSPLPPPLAAVPPRSQLRRTDGRCPPLPLRHPEPNSSSSFSLPASTLASPGLCVNTATAAPRPPRDETTFPPASASCHQVLPSLGSGNALRVFCTGPSGDILPSPRTFGTSTVPGSPVFPPGLAATGHHSPHPVTWFDAEEEPRLQKVPSLLSVWPAAVCNRDATPLHSEFDDDDSLHDDDDSKTFPSSSDDHQSEGEGGEPPAVVLRCLDGRNGGDGGFLGSDEPSYRRP